MLETGKYVKKYFTSDFVIQEEVAPDKSSKFCITVEKPQREEN